ncbi:MAG TPA: hypothetical protein VLT61_12530 [Anaeromyxobacteraceae bacterium]|nr:hypothetical protein [Anaeromyxobacteraceae bacterium]
MIPLLLAALLTTGAEPVAEAAPAEVAPPPEFAVEPAPAEPPPSLAFRGHLEWISAAGGASSRASPVNPGNRVLQVPAGGVQTELRPDLRLEVGPTLTAIARPRFWLRVQKAETSAGWQAEQYEATAEWIEGYAAWRVSDRLSVSYGLQNFQWGPAELVSPSNRIFHASGFYRDPVYVVRGRHLVRANVSAGRAWSLVVLAEVGDNGEDPFVAMEPFERKAQAKLEYTAPAGDLFAALTAGAGARSRGWFGEYATIPLFAGLSAYVDAVHTVGRHAWYPVETPLAPVFAQTGMETRGLRTTALGGLRYSFENGNDLRVEYLFDEAGWTDRQLALAEQAAAASLPALLATKDRSGLDPFLSPGFELLGRHLLYASLSLPDLPPGERTRVQARYLRSLTDGSGVAFLTASYDATDSVVAFISLSATHGAVDGALSRLTRATFAAGATVNW